MSAIDDIRRNLADALKKWWFDWVWKQQSTIEERIQKRLARIGIDYEPGKAPEAEEGETVTPDPASQTIGGSDAYLWKPIGDGGKPGVFLTPCKYRWHGSDTEKGKPDAIIMTRLFLRGSKHDETFSSYQPVDKQGRTGVNGNRIHHRLDRKGEEYGDDFDVVAALADGGEKTWHIDKGAKRQGR